MKKKILIYLTALSISSNFGAQVFADTNNEVLKDLWYAPTKITEDFRNYLIPSWSPKSSYTLEKYINSVFGQYTTIQQRYVLMGYNEMDPVVIKHWESIGMKKELYDSNTDNKWSIFTPTDMDKTGKKTYPVLINMHGGAQSIFQAEGYGYVENASKEKYIVICPNSFNSKDIYDIYQRVKKSYPVDESRVYIAGFSGGGEAAARFSMEYPDIVAGTSPSTGSLVQGNGMDKLDKVSKYGMAMIMCYGFADAEERWPITDFVRELGPSVTKRTVEQRINNVNDWNKACGAISSSMTVSTINSLLKEKSEIPSVKFGLDFDIEYIKNLEVPYYFGDFLNKEGKPVVRYVGITDGVHYITPSWASEVYGFFKNFSRDPKTHKLIINN